MVIETPGGGGRRGRIHSGSTPILRKASGALPLYVYTPFHIPLDVVITSRWTQRPKLYTPPPPSLSVSFSSFLRSLASRVDALGHLWFLLSVLFVFRDCFFSCL